MHWEAAKSVGNGRFLSFQGNNLLLQAFAEQTTSFFKHQNSSILRAMRWFSAFCWTKCRFTSSFHIDSKNLFLHLPGSWVCASASACTRIMLALCQYPANVERLQPSSSWAPATVLGSVPGIKQSSIPLEECSTTPKVITFNFCTSMPALSPRRLSISWRNGLARRLVFHWLFSWQQASQLVETRTNKRSSTGCLCTYEGPTTRIAYLWYRG